MTTKTNQDLSDADLLAAQIALKQQQKQELKTTALTTLHEIEAGRHQNDYPFNA